MTKTKLKEAKKKFAAFINMKEVIIQQIILREISTENS